MSIDCFPHFFIKWKIGTILNIFVKNLLTCSAILCYNADSGEGASLLIAAKSEAVLSISTNQTKEER